MTYVSRLSCSKTGETLSAGRLHNLSPAGWPLLVHYDLERAKAELTKERIAAGPRSMWRYAPLLPLRDEANRVTLGEGWTPLLETPRLGKRLGAKNLWVKDEGGNPTGSFKARGMTAAVSMAKELGVEKLAAPSAGNAASALAAYAARAGMQMGQFV